MLENLQLTLPVIKENSVMMLFKFIQTCQLSEENWFIFIFNMSKSSQDPDIFN